MPVSMSAAVQSLLGKIGYEGKTKYEPEVPQGINDKQGWLEKAAALHNLFVAGIMKSYSEKHYKAAKEYAVKVDALPGHDLVPEGETQQLLSIGKYAVTVQCNRAATQLDETLLKNELMKKLKPDVVEQILEKSRISKKPARVIKVVEISNG